MICNKFIETLKVWSLAKFFFEDIFPEICKSLSAFILGTRYCLDTIDPSSIKNSNIVLIKLFSIIEKISAINESIAVVRNYDGNNTLSNFPALSLSRVLCTLAAITIE